MMLGIRTPNGRTATSMPGAQTQRRVGELEQKSGQAPYWRAGSCDIESSEVKTASGCVKARESPEDRSKLFLQPIDAAGWTCWGEKQPAFS